MASIVVAAVQQIFRGGDPDGLIVDIFMGQTIMTASGVIILTMVFLANGNGMSKSQVECIGSEDKPAPAFINELAWNQRTYRIPSKSHIANYCDIHINKSFKIL